MRRRDALKAIAAAPTVFSSRVQAQQHKYEANWASLDARPIPSWYTDAKFGIFIHWGVYSVPSFAPVNVKDENPYAEWYWNSLTNGMDAKGPVGHGALTWDFHKRVYGANFSYFEFAPMFRAEFFDPDAWADLFVRPERVMWRSLPNIMKALRCGEAFKRIIRGGGPGIAWISARS